MKSNSQVGQDVFIAETFKAIDPSFKGTFLDVGCNDPIHWSNTYALEELGWAGVLVDVEQSSCDLCRAKRPKSLVIHADATRINWSSVLPVKHFDYLSLDVDQATPAALRNLITHGVTWRIATVEHDFWRFGNEPRAEMRALLSTVGYVMVKADVLGMDGKSQFEDWVCVPELAEAAKACLP